MEIDELNYFQNQIKASLSFFESWLYPSAFENLVYHGAPIRKSIFLEKLDLLNYNQEDYEHNCLPCNLTNGANLILYFLDTNQKSNNIKFFINIYSNLLYQQAENFGVIYSKLGFTIKNRKGEFDWNKFPKLQKLKYWANFFKHPKSSMFLHHTTFHIESYPHNPNYLLDGYINSDFVKEYFSGPKLNDKLEKELRNKCFKVLFPDLVEFTKLICDESDNLIQIISSDIKNINELKDYRRAAF